MTNDIRSLRNNHGIRQKDLASLANVSVSELSKVERGLIIPKRQFIVSIASALGVDSNQLLQTHVDLAQQTVAGEGYTTATSEDSFVISRTEQPASNKLRVIDLFCGTGGFSHGFELTEHFQVTAGIDLLPDRIETFAANHPVADAICGDIHEIKVETIAQSEPEPDVIIGGPPCQGFSSIRPFRTLTEDDMRNNLFEQFALVLHPVSNYVKTLRQT